MNDNHLGALLHFRKDLIEYLATNGIRIILCAPDNDNHDVLHFPNVIYSPIKMNRTSKGIKDNIYYTLQLNKTINKFKPDLVINYTIKPIIFGSLLSIIHKYRTISVYAGLSKELTNLSNKSNIKNKIIFKVIQSILKRNDRAFFLNDEDLEFMINNNFYNINNTVLLNGGEGVNTDYYKPIERKKIPNRFKIVMIARVLKTKGYYEFVECAKIAKSQSLPWDFYLCGGIDYIHPDKVPKEEIERDETNGLIIYKGHINNLNEFIGDSDCVVLPSYYNEGMNRSLMEALSMGIPIITTDNRGCRELVINGKTGYIIPTKNPKALFNSLQKLYNLSDEDKHSIHVNSREYALSRFDIKQIVDIYKTEISRLLPRYNLFHR